MDVSGDICLERFCRDANRGVLWVGGLNGAGNIFLRRGPIEFAQFFADCISKRGVECAVYATLRHRNRTLVLRRVP